MARTIGLVFDEEQTLFAKEEPEEKLKAGEDPVEEPEEDPEEEPEEESEEKPKKRAAKKR